MRAITDDDQHTSAAEILRDLLTTTEHCRGLIDSALATLHKGLVDVIISEWQK